MYQTAYMFITNACVADKVFSRNNFYDFSYYYCKKYQGFIQLLVAFPYSNICYYQYTEIEFRKTSYLFEGFALLAKWQIHSLINMNILKVNTKKFSKIEIWCGGVTFCCLCQYGQWILTMHCLLHMNSEHKLCYLLHVCLSVKIAFLLVHWHWRPNNMHNLNIWVSLTVRQLVIHVDL